MAGARALPTTPSDSAVAEEAASQRVPPGPIVHAEVSETQAPEKKKKKKTKKKKRRNGPHMMHMDWVEPED